MAYCEVVTKIGNEFEKLNISDPPMYRCEAPSGTGDIISDIVDDLIDDAVCVSEEKTVKGGGQKLRGVLKSGGHPNVGDALPGGTSSTVLTDKRMTHGANAEDDKRRPNEDIGKPEGLPRGVGDQLMADDEIVPVKETPSTSSRHPVVEKKSRLTDLVKNSKQVLSKFILNESLKMKHDEWEEKNEKELAVVDLERGAKNATAVGQHTVVGGVLPDEVPPTEKAEDALRTIDESNMETVELADRASTLGPSQTTLTRGLDASVKKTLTFPACASKSGRGLRGRFSTMKLHGAGGGGGCTAGLEMRNKKKWNFGSRLINYIRKRSTRTRKDSEKDAE